METAIYGRVSTEEQATEGFSVRAQEQKLKEYANVKDWAIYNIYLDEGISGKNITERPAINRMIEDIKAGRVKNVLVFKLDRLTRSVADLVYLIDLFKKHDCDFNSLTESIDTSTASGRMFIKIIGIFAEFERENIGERVRVGIERKAREGFTTAGNTISYGYNRERGERIQTVNETESQNVKMMFDMFVNGGMSLSGIARSLNMQGIQSKKGCLWNGASVKQVLTNCNHIGNVRHCMNTPARHFECEGKHEPIITTELYNAAQSLIEKNARATPTKRPHENNFFVGFLFCEKCGKRLTTRSTVYESKKGKTTCFNYRCETKVVGGDCNTKAVTAGKVEKALIEYFSKYSDTFETDSTAAALLETEKQNTLTQIQNYTDKLKHFDEKEKEVQTYYIGGNIDFESYRSMKNQLDTDREYIKTELDKLTVDDTPVTIDSGEIVANFQESWQGLTAIEKRMFLTNYIKKIVISNEPKKGGCYGDTKIVSIEFNTN
jgi:site-specific DNA recombinase